MLPSVKKESLLQKKLQIPAELTFSVQEEYAENVKKIFGLFIDGCKAAPHSQAFVKMACEPAFENEEKYSITIDQEGIKILYGGYRGICNAVGTLSQMVKAEQDGYFVPMGYVEDYPDANHRGVMIDLARGYRDPADVKRDIAIAAKAGMNVVHFHLIDHAGICFKADCLPESMCMVNPYTKEQLREFAELCKVLGLEVIPEYDVPGHAHTAIRVFPELCCEVPGLEKPSTWTICTGTDALYDILEKAVAEISELFPGKYFHMGGDELEFGNHPEFNSMCLWEDCVKCKALRQREGIKDRQGQYDYFANRMNKIVKKHGRRMIMWSDQLDCTRPKAMDSDIIMHFWRIAAEKCGPTEGCSMENQVKFGYDMINSNFTDTYIDMSDEMQAEKNSKWIYNRVIESGEISPLIMGSELCAWEYGNVEYKDKYRRGFAPAVYLLADRVWNAKEVVHDGEYSKKLTRAVLGERTPEGFDVFAPIGDLLPNKEKIEDLLPGVKATNDELKGIARVLRETDFGGCDGQAKIYADLYEKILDLKK